MRSELNFYKHVGNFRPTAGTLLEVIESTSEGISRPEHLLRAADACIDMAMLDDARPHTWIDTSRAFCDEALRHTDHEGVSNDKAAPIVTRAILRKSELPNWESVAWGRPPENDYESMLEAAEAVAARNYSETQTRGTLMEFIPILLGARALSQNRPGWLGRLALYREDLRQSGRSFDIKWSWDTLLIPPDAPVVDFDVPNAPVQIKKIVDSGKNGWQSYARAGIISLSAEKAGFALPRSIVWGCIQETGAFVPSMAYQDESTQPVSTETLDAVTHSIDTRLQRATQLMEEMQAQETAAKLA